MEPLNQIPDDTDRKAPPRAVRLAARAAHGLLLTLGGAVVWLAVIVIIGAAMAHSSDVQRGDLDFSQQDATPSATSPAETIPPSTPLPTLTPSRTLRPPPTLEPPTLTWTPSPVPSLTPTPTIDTAISVEGLHGLETPTPTSTQGCELREDWQLTYEVQAHDTMSSIADRYGTWVNELAEGNCIADPNVIAVGQQLRVPGEFHPEAVIECVPWEVLTPPDGMITVPGDGQLTFNWIGPESQLSLIRITEPDGDVIEELVEYRQNKTIDMTDRIPDEGWYSWQVFPLDGNFQQIPCPESPPWRFRKDKADPTPTPVSGGSELPGF
jgi:LysM repeat protein